MKGGIFVTGWDFLQQSEPPSVEMKHPSFWGGLCMCPSIPTQDRDWKRARYISIPGSISMTSNIARNVEVDTGYQLLIFPRENMKSNNSKASK